ncbi:MAG: type II toxin-antitoxin system VapC family toxin [Chloroflexi bacterium]|nr:type II toxin-antitoxin system VapC family toxin [Chloroflexota bacterium]
MPVVDASVIVSIVNAEELYHTQSRSWLNDTLFSGQQIYAPAIVLAEIGAALSRGQRDSALAQRAIQLLSPETLVQLRPISIELGRRAAVIASERQIRGCDAVYLALAERLDTELVTLDRQQLERGAAVVQTRRP